MVTISKNQIKKIIENGGATFCKNGKLAKFKTGFQVSTCDAYKIKITNINKIFEKINQMFEKLQAGEFVGCWVENGLFYLDISKKFDSELFALTVGLINRQLSVYDWKNDNCIDVKKYFNIA